MDDLQYLRLIRERNRRFHRMPGVHLPIYEEHASVDFGRYLCVVRNTEDWNGVNLEDYPQRDSEHRSFIAEHLIRSVQDLDELLEYIERLEEKNRLLLANSS